ncbi:MAG: DNA-3-methyladenine glycosylase [Verrucomicrobiota bacterium]
MPEENLAADFFMRDPETCARELIGCVFRWHGCAGRIVETEAYSAVADEACHTWFRPGARRFVAAHGAGSAYVYLNYGMHWLFNVLVKGGSEDGFVLFRALEPLDGIGEMRERCGGTDARICAGPGKLTKALGINGAAHGSGFLGLGATGIRRGTPVDVLAGPRVGISKAMETPWRFGAAGSPALSRLFK